MHFKELWSSCIPVQEWQEVTCILVFEYSFSNIDIWCAYISPRLLDFIILVLKNPGLFILTEAQNNVFKFFFFFFIFKNFL